GEPAHRTSRPDLRKLFPRVAALPRHFFVKNQRPAANNLYPDPRGRETRMAILQTLSCLALPGVAEGIPAPLGLALGVRLDRVLNTLRQRFSDHSQPLTEALQKATTRAWRALEIALAGESWWDQCKTRLASADEKAFREPMRTFLADHPW